MRLPVDSTCIYNVGCRDTCLWHYIYSRRLDSTCRNSYLDLLVKSSDLPVVYPPVDLLFVDLDLPVLTSERDMMNEER